jgi:hypothetical protein
MKKKKVLLAIAICDSAEAVQKKIENNFMLAGSPQLFWHKTMRTDGILMRANADEEKITQVEDTYDVKCTINTSKSQVRRH